MVEPNEPPSITQINCVSLSENWCFRRSCCLHNHGRSSTLMIEAIGSSIISVHLCWSTWHHIPEDSNLNVQVFSLLQHFSYPHYTSVAANTSFFSFLKLSCDGLPSLKLGQESANISNQLPTSILHHPWKGRQQVPLWCLCLSTWHHIPCDCNHNIHCHENIWSHTQDLLSVWWHERGFMIRKVYIMDIIFLHNDSNHTDLKIIWHSRYVGR